MIGWQEPFTGWTLGSLVSYEDMNRIGGNLNWLLNQSTEESVKETWTQDDFVTLNDWKVIVGAIKALSLWAGVEVEVPTTDLSPENYNRAESATLRLKNPVELIWSQENRYFNDDVFVSADTLMDYVGGGI